MTYSTEANKKSSKEFNTMLDYIDDLMSYMVSLRKSKFKVHPDGLLEYQTDLPGILTFTPFHYDDKHAYVTYTEPDEPVLELNVPIKLQNELDADGRGLLKVLDNVVSAL